MSGLLRILVLPLGFCAVSGVAQTLVPSLVTPLSSALNETSGLLLWEGRLWTQLDSGNPPSLYAVDTSSGDTLRSVGTANAGNVDWEEITTDGTWCYIGDFGNNDGARMDLRIYRFPLVLLQDSTISSVTVDTIRFAFADQTDFTPLPNATNWDCEAMVAVDDSLFLFTKNWQNGQSYLYALPAVPGDHLAQRRDTLDSQGMITGASLDPLVPALALCGYTSGLAPFLWRITGFQGHDFFNGTAQRFPLALPFTQVEGVAWNGVDTVLLSNELFAFSPARLWRCALSVPTALPDDPGPPELQVILDTAQRTMLVTTLRSGMLSLIDAQGRTVLEQPVERGTRGIPWGDLVPGTYVLRLSGDTVLSRPVVLP